MNSAALDIAVVRFFTCALVCMLSAPALSDETWNCRFSPEDSQPKELEAKLVIAGGGIDWQVPVPGVDLPGKPIQTPGGLQLKSVSLKYRVLQDNDAGVVAVGAQSPRHDTNGLALTGEIILLSRTDGRIRMGAIGIDAYKVHDGRCTLISTPSN